MWKKIPFEITSSNNIESEQAKNAFEMLREQVRYSNINDLSLEEINIEIDKSRNKRDIKWYVIKYENLQLKKLMKLLT